MPPLTRWFIKSALVSLILALVARTAMAFWPLLNAPLAPIFSHLFMWGWVTQLIFGVVYWMLPRHTKNRLEDPG